jgi:hypothetical protein
MADNIIYNSRPSKDDECQIMHHFWEAKDQEGGRRGGGTLVGLSRTRK